MTVLKVLSMLVLLAYLVILLVRRLIPKPPCDSCKYLKSRHGDYRNCNHPQVNTGFYVPPDYCCFHEHPRNIHHE